MLTLLVPLFAWRQVFREGSKVAQQHLATVRDKLVNGETVLLAGIGAAGHNSGIALIAVSMADGIRIICNNEEERFSGEKHATSFPSYSLKELLRQLAENGYTPSQIDLWLATWDYPALGATLLRTVVEELPASLMMLRPASFPFLNAVHIAKATRAPRRLARELGLTVATVPIISMPHHENHAWFSYSVSPFALNGEPVIVTVIDGTGDRGPISVYLVKDKQLKLILANDTVFDSLGLFFSFISSTQGGWTMLSSEGRYMGAAAYGNMDRLTNPYYAQLRQIFYLGPDGQVALNRSLANWQCRLFEQPYTDELITILGQPILPKDMWNPDAVLSVEDIQHKEDTQERLDKAAATQLVFEDVLFHIVGTAIRKTGSYHLVLTGGTALNGLANMRLLEHFNESYFKKYYGQAKQLNLWVPPTPGDAGVTLGAAFACAHQAGAGFGQPLKHAFYCGMSPTRQEICAAFADYPEIEWLRVGEVASLASRTEIAELMAFITVNNGVFALVQGAAETGPRALGHRSILANACNFEMREILNARVKYREAIRPLAPMMTLETALDWFELSPGAAGDNYNAYNYMVLTAKAKPAAKERIPAVIHLDGTARLQIVRPETDQLVYAYLQAVGKLLGLEIAINTSFNVGGPIVQTAQLGLATLLRSKGLDGLLLIAAEGDAYMAWRGAASKTVASRFPDWYQVWQNRHKPN
jgi:carbamoyltransferase